MNKRFSRVTTSVIQGIQGVRIDAEVELGLNKPSFSIIGLGDSAIREARDRVSSALTAGGFNLPPQILVNLAPAEIKKEGSSLDLAILVGIILASKQVTPCEDINNFLFQGELSLDGKVRPVRGIVAHTLMAIREKINNIVLPRDNLAEASLVGGINLYPIDDVRELLDIFKGEAAPAEKRINTDRKDQNQKVIFSDVWGQQIAKRALVIAAAGGHNVLLQGPPGCGKSLLAKKFPRLLPKLSNKEMLEVLNIHSIAGKPLKEILQGERPISTPHQSISQVGLIGGGSTNPCPGEISLAHQGVLFLDELAEFKRGVLESLRAPLESQEVEIRRARFGIKLPTKFQLIAAMNLCPCGRLGVNEAEKSKNSCTCPQQLILNYQQRVSQPLRDRIDIQVNMEKVKSLDLLNNQRAHADTAGDLALTQLVTKTRELQLERSGKLNCELEQSELYNYLKLEDGANKILAKAVEKLAISARAYVRVLRVARTIADLKQEEFVNSNTISEAISYRNC
jgi:magnesium chelatase family protein